MKLYKQEEKARARVDELESKPVKQGSVKVREPKETRNIDELERKPVKKGSVKVREPKETRNKGNSDGNTRRSDRKRKQPTKLQESADSLNHLTLVGTEVDVLWTEKELDGTNWEPGWYRGEVQRYDEDDDTLYILYFKDRTVFSLNATGSFADGIIRAV